jgi:hypothetical protein
MLVRLLTLLIVLGAGSAAAQPPAERPASPGASPVRIFLDCSGCFADYVRTEVTFVDYVRDRTEADVHVIVTSSSTGAGGREYTAEFIGARLFDGITLNLKAVTTSNDPEDVVRRQVTNMLRIGFLHYVSQRGIPQTLNVEVEEALPEKSAVPQRDPWNAWVFSVRGSASFEGEESSRERQVNASLSADRITPDWKLTFGARFEDRKERFDLDEDDPVEVNRREREFDWLAVKALGEHWSVGASGDVESSTFSNLTFSARIAPAVEFNVFPYSAYTRRQLRMQYSLGLGRFKYDEITIFDKLEETLPNHELSVTYDQRERWGTLEGRVEWFQYLHDLEKNRLDANGEISLRILRGLSLSAEAGGSRIRDQISLPRRDATPEEILLRLRELQSGYDYDFSLSLTYTFGSIFSAIVNPRFGQ